MIPIKCIKGSVASLRHCGNKTLGGGKSQKEVRSLGACSWKGHWDLWWGLSLFASRLPWVEQFCWAISPTTMLSLPCCKFKMLGPGEYRQNTNQKTKPEIVSSNKSFLLKKWSAQVFDQHTPRILELEVIAMFCQRFKNHRNQKLSSPTCQSM